ncbi:ABC transporter ATP-binding protein [Lentilactobacillus diolivorans]|uniref:ABC transporter ATP-binding protein n=1 Tax=Lentilactobacillus diolivorans TaxID=179838 RepID=UPI002469323A|nr:ABC transporter ATP-binding protein [Lentilactobacillus diolivorans]MDH5106151.1 ABC transporter ATP-binding protein [Lentilactobacillus diolivorans]
MAFISVRNETKRYEMGTNTIVANHDISFDIDQGELVVILGASGAGKSTVLNILGGMDKPSEGKILIDGQDIAQFNDRQLTEYRRSTVGFVFQFYNLIPNLTAKENVELASQVAPNAKDVVKTLSQVGLAGRIDNFPAQLSGGEQQRVAIARALAKNPKVLLCDEPTGALDYETGKQILKLLQDTARQSGMTVIIVTHNSMIASMADKVIHIKDAQVQEITLNESPEPVEQIEW